MNRPVRLSLILGSPFLSGCMMAGGMGSMTGMSPGSTTNARTSTAEAVAESIRVRVEFPPVTAGNEGTIMIMVSDARDAPVAGMTVTLLLDEPAGDVRVLEARAVPSVPGRYHAVHRFSRTGMHVVTAEVRTDRNEASPIVSVTVRQDVAESPIHGRSGLGSMAVAGGAAMLAMMAMMVVF